MRAGGGGVERHRCEAFEDLRAEVSVARRALEDLPQAQPPLTISPATYAEAMRKAGEKAMGPAWKEAKNFGDHFADTVVHKQGKGQQGCWLAAIDVLPLLVGLLGVHGCAVLRRLRGSAATSPGS